MNLNVDTFWLIQLVYHYETCQGNDFSYRYISGSWCAKVIPRNLGSILKFSQQNHHDRRFRLFQVKIFGDDLKIYQQQVKKHGRQNTANRVADEQRLNRLSNEITNFDMQLSNFKIIEDQFNELQSIKKVISTLLS